MMTINAAFWKIRYIRLAMGNFSLGGKFQAKVDELVIEIEDVKTYINDIF